VLDQPHKGGGIDDGLVGGGIGLDAVPGFLPPRRPGYRVF
jgi:hypothetical protein